MLDKFTKEYTLDNINEFYEGLEANPNSKITKFCVWCAYYAEIQRQEECKEVSDAYNARTGGYYTCDKITDNIFIITRYLNNEQKEYYLPCIKKDGIVTRYNVAFETFDQAVIAAYSYFYTGREEAGHWACKLMDIK
nr:MAG TPA: hypothetical protein [Caudoviricetes sp.]